MNRRNAHNAGLFYEDEVEITGVRDDRYEQRKAKLYAVDFHKDGDDSPECEDVTQSVLELLLGQYTVPYPSSSTLGHLTRLTMASTAHYAESHHLMDMLQIQGIVQYIHSYFRELEEKSRNKVYIILPQLAQVL